MIPIVSPAPAEVRTESPFPLSTPVPGDRILAELAGDYRVDFEGPMNLARTAAEPLPLPGDRVRLLAVWIFALAYRVLFFRFWHPAKIVAYAAETGTAFLSGIGDEFDGTGPKRAPIHHRANFRGMPHCLTFFPSAIEKSVDNAATEA